MLLSEASSLLISAICCVSVINFVIRQLHIYALHTDKMGEGQFLLECLLVINTTHLICMHSCLKWQQTSFVHKRNQFLDRLWLPHSHKVYCKEERNQYYTEWWIKHESMWQAHNQTDMAVNKENKIIKEIKPQQRLSLNLFCQSWYWWYW